MSKTPSKKIELSNNFLSKEIISPIKDNVGISKTVYTHITNLYSLLGNWHSIRDKGTKICKSLSSLKLYECEDDYYPYQTKQLLDGLLEALDSLENIVDGVTRICVQMKALAQLQPNTEPIINTWSASDFANSIVKVSESLQKELRLKRVITENIAHCRDENLIEVYISGWEVDVFFNKELNIYLFAEVGL